MLGIGCRPSHVFRMEGRMRSTHNYFYDCLLRV
jgi:hypothetical protein